MSRTRQGQVGSGITISEDLLTSFVTPYPQEPVRGDIGKYMIRETRGVSDFRKRTMERFVE